MLTRSKSLVTVVSSATTSKRRSRRSAASARLLSLPPLHARATGVWFIGDPMWLRLVTGPVKRYQSILQVSGLGAYETSPGADMNPHRGCPGDGGRRPGERPQGGLLVEMLQVAPAEGGRLSSHARRRRTEQC